MSHPPLDCPPFPPATVRQCITMKVQVQNIVEPQEVLLLAPDSVKRSVESILSVDPDAINHNSYVGDGGGEEESLSDCDFRSFGTDDEDDDDDDDDDNDDDDSMGSDGMDNGDGAHNQGPMEMEEDDDRPPPQDVNGNVNGSRNGSNQDVHDSATTAATEGSRNNNGSNKGYRMKAFLKGGEPLRENHHGAYTTYIYYARVLLKADNNWIPTGEEVAIKEVSWSTIRATRNRMSEDFVKEIAALQYISDWHNNNMDRRSIMDTHIMAADTIMSNESHLYIVMPYCAGDLFSLVAERDETRLTEDESRFWFRQILSALESLQLMQLCHKDLSPENFMILDDASLAIDFGMCLRIPYMHARRHLITPRTACGKLPHVAPEILKHEERQYPFDGHAVDIWAAGTILLFLLTGMRLPHPYLAESILQREDLGVSYEALDLLRTMLRLNPNHRLSFDQVRNHNWVQQEYM